MQKLDEQFETKNASENLIATEEDNSQMPSMNENIDDVPHGVSIESASYIENNNDNEHRIEVNTDHNQETIETINNEEEYTPQLFSDEENQKKEDAEVEQEHSESNKLFEQDISNEEDEFEIPAFLRRQKF